MKRNIMMLFMILALCLTLALPAFATDSSKLIDDADILSRSEETELLEELEDLSEQYDADFVIITMSTLDGYDIDYYAENARKPSAKAPVTVLAGKSRPT